MKTLFPLLFASAGLGLLFAQAPQSPAAASPAFPAPAPSAADPVSPAAPDSIPSEPAPPPPPAPTASATPAVPPRLDHDSDTRPNILLLLSDDAGWADFGFMPHAAADVAGLTPRIDSIAAAGVRLDDAYMSGCVCSPSRAGLLSGRYQERFGHDNNLAQGFPGGLDLQQTLLPERLRRLGYYTGLVGKWHLGYPAAYQPNQRGFDFFHGLLMGSRSYLPLADPAADVVIQQDGEPQPETGFVTDRLGDAACRFLQEQAPSARPDVSQRRPFFLFVSFTAPHSPLTPKPEDLAGLEGIPDEDRRHYLGLLRSLDANVGRILDCLAEQGLEENTLVVFTNDNGGQNLHGAVNLPLRGRKGMLFEGGIRVPWAMRWPGTIAPGGVLADPVISLDLAPTLLELARAQPPVAAEFDGRSLLPLLRGEKSSLPERPLFWRWGGFQRERAVRLGEWKLVEDRRRGGGVALFNLAEDLGEQHDLAAARPEQVRQLLLLLDTWESGLVQPHWGPGAPREAFQREEDAGPPPVLPPLPPVGPPQSVDTIPSASPSH